MKKNKEWLEVINKSYKKLLLIKTQNYYIQFLIIPIGILIIVSISVYYAMKSLLDMIERDGFSVNIGYLIEDVKIAISQNVKEISPSLVGFVFFLLFIFILYRVFSGVNKTINIIKNKFKIMKSVDFTKELSYNFLNKKDEFRVTAKSLDYTQKAIRSIIGISNRKRMEELIHLEKEHFNTTLLSIGDGVIYTNEKGQIILMNKVAEKLIGCQEKEILGKNIEEVFRIMNEYTKETCKNLEEIIFKNGGIMELANYTVLINKDGKMIPIEDNAAPIINIHGKLTGAVIVFRDITEKREKQKQIEYLNYHDYMTGLYNRRYIEDAIKQMDIEENLPITLMVLDINGLKLTNESFGNAIGDRLLKVVADILKRVCHYANIIARIDGDEFCILLPNTNHDQAMSIKNRIIEETAITNFESAIISVAVGYEVKTEGTQNIEDIIKNAENSMYKIKMNHGRFMRSQMIENVLRNINLKYDNEQVHAERVAQYCEMIGRAINFSDREVYMIKQAGVLHDIGKIIVDPELLNKKGELTNDEFEIIRKHTETGYHILKNAEDYLGLAKIVRYHHERFDGKGYPDKLIGYEIPLESRIIAVADSYEAMTANRPYQKTKSKKDALLEIERCAGTQFDPQIVEVFLRIMNIE